MKFLFIVQGEGRGHLTQSVAMSELLEEAGHTIEKVYAGYSPQRTLPDFYRNHFNDKLVSFRSPNFIRTADRKGIRVGRSLWINLFLSPLFVISVLRLARAIRRSSADTVINFYDLTGSLAHFFSFTPKKLVVLSHHYYFELPGFAWPPGYRWMRFLLRLHSRIVSQGASTIIALSFTSEQKKPHERIVTAPPLIRKKVKTLSVVPGRYYLVYLLNEGFLDEVCKAAGKYPDTSWHIYTGTTGHQITGLPNVTLSDIRGGSFMEDMAGCREVICTAGFETVCEAAYLGKPVHVIPSEGHFEQMCNALDAERSGLAKRAEPGAPDELRNKPEPSRLNDFRKWCDRADTIFRELLCE